jgi:hypothetical protein
VLSHVLEHVYDLPGLFAAVRRLLAPGGHVYIETPDATRYESHLAAPFQEFNTEHINHFSAQALKTTAYRYGFQPVVVEQKILRTGKDTLYPAVFGVFQDCGAETESRPTTCDHELLSRIEAYVRRSTEEMERIERHLANQLARTPRIIVWGAGQLSMKLLALPSLAQTQIRAFVDSNPVLRGKRLAAAPIVGPREISGTSEPILIATLLHADEIATQIRRLGMDNPILELPQPGRAEGASS